LENLTTLGGKDDQATQPVIEELETKRDDEDDEHHYGSESYANDFDMRTKGNHPDDLNRR
jgi:hypothetical protein